MRLRVLVLLSGILPWIVRGEDACCAAPPAEAETGSAWSDTSLFHLESGFVNTEGETVRLADLAGAPTVMAMFYSNCPTVCPRLIAELRRLEGELKDGAAERLRVVLVTLDAERDTPERLRTYAEHMRIDLKTRRLWSGEAKDLRTLAALLGVRYRKEANGAISHSAPIVLLDGEGRIVARMKGAGVDTTAFVRTLQEQLDPEAL